MMCSSVLMLSANSSAQFLPTRQLQRLFQVFGEYRQNLGGTCSGLGDVNRDDKPDFSVGTYKDTTFIYFGGKGVLDTLWDLKLPGGLFSTVSGDFDDDGIIDLVLYGYHSNGTGGSVNLLLLYKGLGHSPFFTQMPTDTVLIVPRSLRHWFPKMRTCDMNGDKISDLLVFAEPDPGSKIDDINGTLYLLFGGRDFLQRRLSYYNRDSLDAQYAKLLDCADLNGEGFDDLVIFSQRLLSRTEAVFDFNLEIYYGKADISQKDSIPDASFHSADYPFLTEDLNKINGFSMVDLNGDKKMELCFRQGDSLIFQMGHADKLKKLGPFESIPNVDTNRFVVNPKLQRIGDVNGDGYPDLLLVMSNRNIPAAYFTVYLCGPRWYTIPAYYYLYSGLNIGNITDYCGIGDVNGDGGAEFMISRPRGENNGDPFSYQNGHFIIIKSDTLLKLRVESSETERSIIDFNMYPNPAVGTSTIEVINKGALSEHVELELTDTAGKAQSKILEECVDPGIHRFHVDFSRRAHGMYFLRLMTKNKVTLKKIINIR